MDLSALVVGVLGLIALVTKLTDFLRLVTNFGTQRPAILTQLSAWAAGVAGVFLYSASDFGKGIVIEDMLLNDMSTATKLILGLAIGSAASVAVDYKQAIDSSDSAAKPELAVP